MIRRAYSKAWSMQLCLGMVALAVHMPPEEWGTGGVVQWLGKELGSHADAIPCLLELVTVLPQVSWSLATSRLSCFKDLVSCK